MRLAWCLVLVAVLSGCGASPARQEPVDDRPLVLPTFSVLADLADTVAGGHVRVESITKVGAEIHGYEPTPSDLVRAQDADLILDNGLGLERWFERFLTAIDAPHVVLSDGVEPLDIRSGDYSGRANPHAWMSPLAAQTYVDNTVDALSGLDPDHAGDFEANGRLLKEELADLLAAFRADIARVEAPALVTCEGAFSYLARDAGLKEVYIWAVNAEQQATPQQITRAIEYVKENQVPAVFCESTVSDAPMQQVVGATGAKFGGTLYVDSLSEADGPVPTYLDLIRHDADVITKALAGTSAGATAGAKP